MISAVPTDVQGNYDRAKELCKRALDIKEKVYGSNHEEVATVLNDCATLSEKQVI